MEAVVLRRVGFLAYSCPKQGQDFKPLAAPLHPNMGQVPPPPSGFMECNQLFMQCNAKQYMLHGVYSRVYCLPFRPAQMYSLHSWASSTTTLVFVFLGSHNCIKVTLTIRCYSSLPLQTPKPRKCSSRESRIKLLDCPTDFIKNKYWETKVFLRKNKSHFL